MPENKFPYKANAQVQNSYGFGILTEGIDLTRYKKNPIVLKNHSTDNPVGTAADLKFSGQDFDVVVVIDDTEDAGLQKLVRDINKKLYQGLSMGIDPDFSSIQHGVPGFPPELPVITKSELMELSITPLPSNGECLRFTHKGKNLSAQDVMIRLSADPNNQIKSMNKLLLALVPVLGLSANATEDDAIGAFKKLAADLDELKTLRQAKASWEQKEADMKLSRVKSLVDGAVTAGKILPAQREDFITLANADFDAAQRTLDALPVRVSLSAKTKDAGAPADGSDQIAGKTFKQLMKENPEALVRLKAEDPERWKRLFNEERWNK